MRTDSVTASVVRVGVDDPSAPMRVVGRYALYGEIASGGMATVHLGRLLGPVGFSRTVAIKRLHSQFAKDPEFVSMFLDEARLAARVRHLNVVPTLDVVATEGELFLVMDYVQGESLAKLGRIAETQGAIPVRIIAGILVGALHGLHAAHEAKSERGEKLDLVHRDISPQNILVGVDGVARVLDFGVAKATGRLQTTREGHLKGKLSYMAPEQVSGRVTRQTDVYAAGIVLWEALTGVRLFRGDTDAETLHRVISGVVAPPSQYAANLPPGLDAVVLGALRREPTERYATAREFAVAIERCTGIASPTEIGEWVEAVAHDTLLRRAERVNEIESGSAPFDDAKVLSALQPSSHDARASIPVMLRHSESQLSSISGSMPWNPPEPRRRSVGQYAAFVGAALLLVFSVAAVVVILASRRVSNDTALAPKATSKAIEEPVSAPPVAATVPATSVQDVAKSPAAPSAKPAAKPRPPATVITKPRPPGTTTPKHRPPSTNITIE